MECTGNEARMCLTLLMLKRHEYHALAQSLPHYNSLIYLWRVALFTPPSFLSPSPCGQNYRCFVVHNLTSVFFPFFIFFSPIRVCFFHSFVFNLFCSVVYVSLAIFAVSLSRIEFEGCKAVSRNFFLFLLPLDFPPFHGPLFYRVHLRIHYTLFSFNFFFGARRFAD